MFDDWPLVEASFAQQYGIRLEREHEMSWTEFGNLLNGLLDTSPLGQIVSIRAETDPERLKAFTKDQNRIRSEWRSKVGRDLVSKMTHAEKAKESQKLQELFKTMFSSKGKGG